MMRIICENSEQAELYVPIGTTLRELCSLAKPKLQYEVLGALVNNKAREMSYPVFKPKKIRFFDITHTIGQHMYFRSLSFLLHKAVKIGRAHV